MARAATVGAAVGVAAFYLASLVLARTPLGADHAPASRPRRARGTRKTART